MRRVYFGKIPFLFIFAFIILSCKENRGVAVLEETEQRADAEKPVVIEIVTADEKGVNIEKLQQVLAGDRVDQRAVYQWKNHLVVFDTIRQLPGLYHKILASFPGARLKIYEHPFYTFDRKHCDSSGTAREWDHIILTADLVADTQLQKEYLDYHATQFKKWPEVAMGFCKAHFQQLLLYKNGRQLMLVISIPKGESLDQLNPKTTENNPKVEQWNALMKKYQQGIAGTGKNEVWVFFKQVPTTENHSNKISLK